MDKEELDALGTRIIGAAIEVHRHLGPGLLESAYRMTLCRELALNDLRFETELPLPLHYKGIKLDCGYRLDVVVEGEIVLELKAIDSLLPIHEAQLLSYLRLSNRRLGYLINFHEQMLKNGIKRFII
jgi:GxxExxY protein